MFDYDNFGKNAGILNHSYLTNRTMGGHSL